MNVEEAIASIEAYLRNKRKYAYFVSVDGAEYVALKEHFSYLSTFRASSFCRRISLPDQDEMFFAARNLESDSLCLGVGETLSLIRNYSFIHRLRCYVYPKKLVVLCRRMEPFLRDVAFENLKFAENFCCVDSHGSFSVIQYEPSLQVESAQTFSELLHTLEDGATGTLKISMEYFKLANATQAETAYDAVRYSNPGMNIPENVLTADQWFKVLHGDKTCLKYLRAFKGTFENDYERLAFEQSRNFDEFEKNITHALLKLKPNAPDFDEKYQLRKSMVSKSDEKHLPSYVEAAKALGSDGVNYLTDNTRMEFQAAVELASNRIALEKNFPAVRRYMLDYEFKDERLTKYFRQYKELKLFRNGTEEFLPEVVRQSDLRLYNEQDTRAAVLERLGKAALYWLDGLSVDFLSYIKHRLTDLNLRSRIRTARAELPTLTTVNRFFYDEWPFFKFPKNERLDKLRHQTRQVSAYFCDEVFIIEDALIEIALALRRKDADKVILTSDHGSTCGPVLCRGHPIKLNAKGEHGGRCCKIDARDTKPKCAVEANGYYALTNYDRIQGGRLEGAEVHGGATLEEVLVPVIEIFA